MGKKRIARKRGKEVRVINQTVPHVGRLYQCWRVAQPLIMFLALIPAHAR
jgi:hypothetical protein